MNHCTGRTELFIRPLPSEGAARLCHQMLFSIIISHFLPSDLILCHQMLFSAIKWHFQSSNNLFLLSDILFYHQISYSSIRSHFLPSDVIFCHQIKFSAIRCHSLSLDPVQYLEGDLNLILLLLGNDLYTLFTVYQLLCI